MEYLSVAPLHKSHLLFLLSVTERLDTDGHIIVGMYEAPVQSW